jgi:hypothetical protein
MSASRWSSAALLGAAGLVLAACQSDNPTGVPANAKPETFQVTAANYTAARAATNNKTKLFWTNAIGQAKLGESRHGLSQNLVNSPWDVTWNGGPTVARATQWNLYIDCATTPAGCWGTGAMSPKTFLHDFQASSFIQILGQYTHADPTGAFATINERSSTVTFAPDSVTGTPTMTSLDLLAILHAASQATGKSGYNQIYHVFIPAGVDMCTAPGNCYSPDNFNTFVFCAFHGSVDFGPHWHVLFTMEPYQFVPGCDAINQPRVIDATASTLSHEFSELTSDPDLDAWFNDLTGNEIGDLCFTFRNPEQLATNAYVIQEEYSNTVHACTDGAF